MNSKVKILYTTPVITYPYRGGPALRVANSIKALSNASELHVISRVNQSALGGKFAEDYYSKLCTNFDYVPSQKMFSEREFTGSMPMYLLNNIFDIAKERIYRAFNSDLKFLLEYIRKHDIQIVWFGFGNISFDLMKSVRSALPNIKIICDTDSVWSKFLLRELPFIQDDNRKKEIEQKGKSKEKEESEWVNFADITTAVSEIDADYYRSLALNTNKIKIFANVIDLDDYNFVPNQPDKHTRPAIFMGGTFWKDSPMEKAARWFISEIYSKLSNGIHGLKLYIVGKNSDKILSDIHHKDIIITGEVESVLPYLCYSDLAVVPLFFESGTRFKILEAGACRIPVVSTTLGAEGIDIIDGKNILIADTAEDFIESVTKLINHRPLAFEMSERLNMLVKSNYSINTLERQALEIIKYLTEN